MASKRKPVVQAAKSTRKRTFSLTPAQFRYRWVKALESGKYKQGKGSLHRINEEKEHEFCCLGVACDLYKKLGGRLPTIKKRDLVQYGGCDIYLPPTVKDALGLSATNGSFASPSSLADMNDNGKSFKEIAAVIRSKPEGLIAS